MDLAAVQARDIHALIDISLKEIKMLEFIICTMELKYDGTIPEQCAAKIFLTEELFPKIKMIRQKMEEMEDA